ncbi:MAG: carboxypeptidase-like regulatory domain-containing protein, partial [Fibrobacteria bacterium]
MRKRISALLSFSIGITSAQSINVRGNVADASGNPVSNATVEIMGKALRAVSGADGAYAIVNNVSLGKGFPAQSVGRIRLTNNLLEFLAAEPSRIQVEIYDMSAHLLDRVTAEIPSSGRY